MKPFGSLWMLVASCMSFVLLGATESPSPFPAPVVVVYPLTASGQTPPEAGGNIALLLATKLSQLGGVDVKPSTPGTDRSQFLTAAAAVGADYYITGFLTPVGPDVSLIIQVVSMQSGSVLYSNTSTVRTYSDVVDQADPLREAMLRHADRGLPSVQQVNTAATAAPVASGGSVNLMRALGHHNRRETVATAAAPALPWGLVVAVDGGAADAQKTTAQGAVSRDLRVDGLQGQVFPISSSDAQHNAADLCKANPAAVALFLTTLDDAQQSVNLSVTAVGCNGATLDKQSATETTTAKGGLEAAIERAAAQVTVGLAASVKPLASPAPKS